MEMALGSFHIALAEFAAAAYGNLRLQDLIPVAHRVFFRFEKCKYSLFLIRLQYPFPGKDTKAQKATYPAIVGLEKSRKIAEQLTQRSFNALKAFRGQAVALEALAEYLLKRDR